MQAKMNKSDFLTMITANKNKWIVDNIKELTLHIVALTKERMYEETTISDVIIGSFRVRFQYDIQAELDGKIIKMTYNTNLVDVGCELLRRMYQEEDEEKTEEEWKEIFCNLCVSWHVPDKGNLFFTPK